MKPGPIPFLLALLSSFASVEDKRESTVGMPARIEEIVLPGTELEATPGYVKSPLVLRITATRPHGTELRYDLEYSGLDPGSYDLKDWLRRKDGSSTADLPSIPVTIRSVLPAGQVRPHPPGTGSVPSFGGYRALLVVAGVIWAAGLAALLLAGRRRKSAEAERARPRTLA